MIGSNYSVRNLKIDARMKQIASEIPLELDKNLTPQCKIVVYKWKTEELNLTLSDVGLLSDSTPYDISSKLISFNYRKSLDGVSGSFSFVLANNVGVKSINENLKTVEYVDDWKNFIKPGTWCVVYLSQDGNLRLSNDVEENSSIPMNKYIRVIGYIDRIAPRASVNPDGSFDIFFEVSGRDFGVVYEETTLWQNMFVYEKALLDATKSYLLDVVGNKTLQGVVTTLHHLFFAPWKIVKTPGPLVGDGLLTGQVRQWLLPRQMLIDLNLPFTGYSYYGNLTDTLNIQPTGSTTPINNPLDYLSGNAWSKLQEVACLEYHELFCELNADGQPKLTYRPIPWATDKTKYPKAGEFITLYKDIEKIMVLPIDIEDFDLGEDNHNRKNHYLTKVETSLFQANDNISGLKGSRFPLQVEDSVARHGFRPMHTDLNSLTYNELKTGGVGDVSKLVEYNEIMFDYWHSTIFYESGSMTKVGSNDVKVGIGLVPIGGVPYINDKLFYIEGYTDNFTIDDKGVGEWTQQLDLAHGVELAKLEKLSSWSFREKDSNMPIDAEYTAAKDGK